MYSLKEYILGNEALLAGIAVCTVVLDAVRDLELIVHAAEVLDEGSDLLIIVGAFEVHVISNNAVALLSCRILSVERDYLRQVHCVCCAVDNMCAVILEDSAGLVSHGMNDAKQCVRERHTSKALCIVHSCTCSHVAVVGLYQVSLDHLDSVDSECVCEVAVSGGYVCLDSVGHSVHTGMSCQLLRHCLCKVGINDLQ